MSSPQQQNPLFSGYLFKRSPSGTWQKRYCLALKNKLVYYKHKSRVDKGSPQGTISLVDCTCARPEPGDMHTHRREHCFILRSNTTREFYWAAESKADVDKWFSILNGCIQEIAATSTKVGPHCLKKVHFSKPTICAKCSSMISGLGKQGFMCKVCLLCVHKKCEHKLGDYCMKIKLDSNQQMSPASKAQLGRLSQYHHNTVGLDVKQLRQVMVEFENEERLLIETANTKYDLQANEIYDELFLRYQAEIQPVVEKANREKKELLREIQLREATLKKSM